MGNIRQRMLVVDGNSILNRAFYGIRALSTRDGQPTNAIYGMVNIVTSHWERVKPDYAAMAFDLKAPTFRHKLYDEYKAGRRPTPEELLSQFALAKEVARALGFHVIEREGFEADDILGTLSSLCARNDCDCYVLTGDRDALQLIDPHVHVLLATNSDTIDYTEQVFFEKYGVMPCQFVDVKALMGDSSDHIPGVPGIGEKTALKLIADYRSLDGVYDALPDAPLTPSVKAKLKNGKDSAYLSQTLARICREVPLGDSIQMWASEGIDRRAALQLFTRLEFSAYIKRMNLTEATENTPTDVKDTSERAVSATLIDLNHLPDTTVTVALALMGDKLQLFDGTTMYECPFPTCLTPDEQRTLQAYLEQCDRLICYDCKTVYHQLDARGVLFRNCHFDVMLAAYVLNAGEGKYALDRLSVSYLGEVSGEQEPQARLIYRLWPVMEQQLAQTNQTNVLHKLEMPLAAVLTDMERDGFRICTEGILAYGQQLETVARELENRIFTYVGHTFNINSPKQLGEVLFGEHELALPTSKKSKTGYSTSAEVLERLRPYHPVIDDILDYRQVTKLKSTYVDGLIKVADENGRVHTTFKQTGTATGRLSSAEPNLQNIPIRTELGRELRRFFVPRSEKNVLIDADYSQIELRLLAAISGDETMRAAFCEGMDIHTSTAATVFGVEPDEVTLDLRKKAKAINFGIVYGMGEFSLSEDLHITRKQAKEYIDSYLSGYPKVQEYLENIKITATEQGYVTTMLGRRRYIPELSSPNKNLKHFGERVAMNSPIQGTAADIIKLAMIAVHRKLKQSGLDATLILQVHDELLIEANRDCCEQVLALLKREMEHAVELCVPLDVEAAIGENWYEAK